MSILKIGRLFLSSLAEQTRTPNRDQLAHYQATAAGTFSRNQPTHRAWLMPRSERLGPCTPRMGKFSLASSSALRCDHSSAGVALQR
ncbi:hypothetical protein BP00DRAFT_162718 [Aspergillus indologenus CBS 114.80]|uniref:Uncharacterized protein n=1 Tax=Aspergillus indologenus CBS 114.80 TaxID=1450541 RepID=A0A2V5I5U9_9EURO|nr:hypothetical protein BP00DRAFT_162718 [Aspergillus indologenus CBS 114.80]